MITGINKSRTLIKHISCECKCKFGGSKCNSNRKQDNDKCHGTRKNLKEHCLCKKIMFRILLNVFPNGTYLENIIDDSVIIFDEIISAADSVSTKVTSTVSTNVHNKKLRYRLSCYILHMVLWGIILLFIIAIICYHHGKHG